MTTIPSPTAPLNGHDLLRALELPIEGPILWGRPVVPSGPGVFIVELPAPQPKVSIDPTAIRQWLERAPDLRLDGKRPTVAELQTRLASFWLPGQVILYVGSSQKSVGARLSGMYKTPLGERRPQSAGYWLNTLRDVHRTRIWWSPTAEGELWEDALLDRFVKEAGALPYAVLATPSGEQRAHGLTAPLHDENAGKAPSKSTHVTVLPDGQEEVPPARGPSRGARASAARASAARRPAEPRPVSSRDNTPRRRPIPRAEPTTRARRLAAPPPGMAIAPTHLTAEGLANLRTELEELTTRRRPEVIARIKAARELGDLSENADYEAARKEQSFLEGRVQQLEQMIKHAVIIQSTSDSGSVVELGSTVVVETDRHGEETFQIVGSAEADASAGKISFTSPIGRALIGRKAGEKIRVEIPQGSMDFLVVEVR
ncbi:MAG: transcription elongation factor GreA [Candidatus Limnocylindrales bacterium]